jgi:hypothetical protein
VNLTTTYDLFHFPSAGILRCSTLPPGTGCLLIAYQDIEAAALGNAGHPPPGDSRSLQGTAFTFCLPRGGYWWLKLDRIPTPIAGLPSSTVKWEFIPTETEPGGSGGVFGPGNNLLDEGFSEVNDGGATIIVPGHTIVGDQVLLFGSSRQAKYRYFEIQAPSPSTLFIRYGDKPTIAGVDAATLGEGYQLNGAAANANANRFYKEMYGGNLWRGDIWATGAGANITVYVKEGG